MRKRRLLSPWLSVFAPAVLMLLASTAAVGSPGGGHGGGGGGGFHGGGGGGHGGGAFRGGGGGFRGSSGYTRGPYHGSRGYYGGGGYRGGPGYYGGYGYYAGGYRGWHGWWGGVGLGFYVPVLPWYYETLWWGDTPYYYADNTYYVWDGGANEYQAIDPPADVRNEHDAGTVAAPGAAANDSDLFAYPRGGQSVEQQARDRDECRHWADSQSGGNGAPKANEAANGAQAPAQVYLRAEAACLEGRNYTVR